VPALSFNISAVAIWIDNRAGNNESYAIRINRTKGTTFDTWRKLRWGTNDLANPAISGEAADPDGDGISNLAEYALGLEPNHPDAQALGIAQDDASSGRLLKAGYDRLAVLSDINFSWQTSTNLSDWTAVIPEHETVSTAGEQFMEHVEASFPVTGAVRFYRLAISRRLR